MNYGLTKNGDAEKANHREYDRYAVHWQVVIIYKKDGKDATFHGRTYDLSLGGACIYADQNIFVLEPVAMTIRVHTNHHSFKVIGVKCSMLYNIISSNYGKFRIGIQFLEFNGDGKKVLAEALSKRPVIKDEDVKKKEIREEEIREEELRKKEIRRQGIKEQEARAQLEREVRTQLEKEIRTQLENETTAKAAGDVLGNNNRKYGRLNDG